jgi:hypothetical protein
VGSEGCEEAKVLLAALAAEGRCGSASCKPLTSAGRSSSDRIACVRSWRLRGRQLRGV